MFVVGINNFGKRPVDFRVSEVDARQHVGASDYGMQVVTFEMLVQEEKNRQVAAAILLTGVAGAANSSQRLSRRPRLLHDARRSNRNSSDSPDRRRHRAEQRRDAERSDVRGDGRNRSAKYGDAGAIGDQGQHADAR